MNELENKPGFPTYYGSVAGNNNFLAVQAIKTKTNVLYDDKLVPHVRIENPVKRYITVHGRGEVKLPPDQVKMIVIITSVKDNIDEAKNSVYRRFEYVYQSIRKMRVPESSIDVSKTYNRKDSNYEVVYEISTNFNDISKFQHINNLLIEKLDKTVQILKPIFFHSSARIEQIKHQASIQAIRNAKHLALDIAQSVHLFLGKPSEITQESIEEKWGDSLTTHLTDYKHTLSDLINQKVLAVTVTIRATFELKQGPRKD